MITCLVQSIFSTQLLLLDYVNVLNNICQKRRISVTYGVPLRELGPQDVEIWSLTVYGKTSYLHAILISNLPGCSGSDRVR